VKLRVTHKTSYAYTDPVSTSHHLAHLAPRGGEGRLMVSHDVAITPQPSVSRERLDYFGNRTLYFSVREPHRALDVVATSLVDVAPLRPPRLEDSPPWNEIRDRLRRDRRRDLLDAYSFTFDSPFARATADIGAYAAPSFPEGRPLLAAVRELTHRIHEDFEYDPAATDVSTGLDVVFAQRRGVCQDFAHMQIACLRILGLPVRYVSGYLVTHPPPGRPRLVGADASHAWVSVFAPDLGWTDFDPTNDLLPSDEHVTVALGRDFADVTPLKGVILGGGRHEVRVSVDVEPLG
jgi:transglutaminase-like putative cysteine protease